MNQREIEQRAEDLVGRAESGDKDGLSAELNSMTMEDRLAVAREMDRLNEERRASNPGLPDIEINVTTDTGGREHLADVNVLEERSWYNPARWFGDKFSREDVYDPPGDELGSGMAQQAADAIRDRYRRIDEVSRL
jgi:hypothetical protein